MRLQCNEVRKKANRILSILQRNLSSCDAKIKERAYVSLVRPIAEYATTAWSQFTIKGINCVEGIQRRAARFVCHDYRRDSSVSAMIDQLGWQSLQKRRVENDLLLFYKIHNKEVDIPFPPELTSIGSSHTRGHK